MALSLPLPTVEPPRFYYEWDRLELQDGRCGAFGRGACERFASKNFAWRDADVPRVRALAAYQDFLALLKDADPDIPILKRAKAEYARLQAAVRCQIKCD